MPRFEDSAILVRQHGIHVPDTVVGYMDLDIAMDAELAMDAQPALVTISNSGIPAFLTNYLDPQLIEVLTTANKGSIILGEKKKGDRTTPTALFPVIESAGEVSSYDDFSNNGAVTANANWPQRQSYHFQTVTQWGDVELERMGKGKIDWANQINISAARIMAKFQNKSYFSGISGLQNYGILNDPSLSAAAAPTTKAAGGTTWAVATALEIYADIEQLYTAVVNQSGGLVEMDAKCKLCMSPAISVSLTKVTQYNVNIADMLKKNFPGMTIETAVEYATASGQVVQLIVDSVEGQDVGYCSFTEKMRAGPVKVELSSFQQKKSGGTWGAIITQPMLISQLIGV